VQKEVKYAFGYGGRKVRGQRVSDSGQARGVRVAGAIEASALGQSVRAGARLLKALAAVGRAAAVPAVSSKLRVTVHAAVFVATGVPCFFLNVTNVTSGQELEVTHVWFATSPEVQVMQADCPLPKRLKPQETWETWVLIADVPGAERPEIYGMGRARLSTGEIVCSERNEGVPAMGMVPGGPIRRA
jgi:hypothetical protein